MKKIYFFILFFSIFYFSSCKKHAIAENHYPDYIVGEWKLQQVTVYGNNISITDCHKRSRMTFSSNHDAHAVYYTIYQSTGSCVKHLEYTGQWTYRNGTFYFDVRDTSGANQQEQKELTFTDPDHFFIRETVDNIPGIFYFEKIGSN